ncbi:MAG: hypothetical protein D6784_04875 [Chloroflexi bacterium]|nr:MAG: hypothetical protein D6784_04875 [Chloroflexota bacterium]
MELITRIINAIVDVHPLHSMTVHFPIALTGVAFFFLLLALWQKSEALERAAFFNMVLAVISVIVAAITGIRDNIVRFEGDAPLVGVKLFLAASLFVLTLVLVVSRWRRSEIVWTPATMVLYLAGYGLSFVLASVLGFLGGVILYGF